MAQLLWDCFTFVEDSFDWVDTKKGKRKSFDATCNLCPGHKKLKCTHASTTGLKSIYSKFFKINLGVIT